MKLKIPLTDKSNYEYLCDKRRMEDTMRGVKDNGEMSDPVIVFFNGDAAYKFVSDSSIPGFGKHAKYQYYFRMLQNNNPIEISLIDTVVLERGNFRISDGRHRAVVLALRNEILKQMSASPASEPELFEKEPVPFLTFRDAAEVMRSKGWLVPPSIDFDLQACSSKVFS